MGLGVITKWKPVGEKTRSICADAKHRVSTGKNVIHHP
jgi:hypothetical protein